MEFPKKKNKAVQRYYKLINSTARRFIHETANRWVFPGQNLTWLVTFSTYSIAAHLKVIGMP